MHAFGQPLAPDQAATIAQACGYLPGYLRLVGCAIKLHAGGLTARRLGDIAGDATTSGRFLNGLQSRSRGTSETGTQPQGGGGATGAGPYTTSTALTATSPSPFVAEVVRRMVCGMPADHQAALHALCSMEVRCVSLVETCAGREGGSHRALLRLLG